MRVHPPTTVKMSKCASVPLIPQVLHEVWSLFGLAMDLTAPAQLLPDVVNVAHANHLIAVQERGHVHVQMFPKGALARAGVRFPG